MRSAQRHLAPSGLDLIVFLDAIRKVQPEHQSRSFQNLKAITGVEN